jgi:hypothetical protein
LDALLLRHCRTCVFDFSAVAEALNQAEGRQDFDKDVCRLRYAALESDGRATPKNWVFSQD